ncbi:MAG: protein kinase [Lentisphaeraceae bacterium]|nr:protein kinase [Lentisphaeraceae bacterium]
MPNSKDLEQTSSLADQTVILDNPNADGPQDKTRILVVEDEAPLRNLLVDVMLAENYHVEEAESADIALPMVRENDYDLILSDVMMPGISGIDFLAEVKRIKPYIEFIIMTGFPKVDAAVHAIKVGAFDYISKPFEIAEICERASAAIAHSKKTSGPLTETITDSKSTRYLAGYSIIRTLGEGTMGIVFLAERVVNQQVKQFALKIIKAATHSGKNEAVERFFKEAKTAGQMNHPNIVRVLEHGYAREENIPYLVMEFFEGKTLKKAITDGDELDLTIKVKIILQIASALKASHEQNIIHRDIKPDNIMINELGQAKLADFGIAQLPNSEQTNVMKIIGTPYYLAPEGYNCPKVGHQADIYSLGTVAYELFLGARPFEAETISSLGFKVQTVNPIEPLKIDKHFPANLQPILEKMLMKDIETRYQTAGEVIDDINKVLQNGLQKKKVLQRVRWCTVGK